METNIRLNLQEQANMTIEVLRALKNNYSFGKTIENEKKNIEYLICNQKIQFHN